MPGLLELSDVDTFLKAVRATPENCTAQLALLEQFADAPDTERIKESIAAARFEADFLLASVETGWLMCGCPNCGTCAYLGDRIDEGHIAIRFGDRIAAGRIADWVITLDGTEVHTCFEARAGQDGWVIVYRKGYCDFGPFHGCQTVLRGRVEIRLNMAIPAP